MRVVAAMAAVKAAAVAAVQAAAPRLEVVREVEVRDEVRDTACTCGETVVGVAAMALGEATLAR